MGTPLHRAPLPLAVAAALAALLATGGPGGPARADEPGPAARRCLEQPLLDRIPCLADAAASAGDVAVCDAADHEGVRLQCHAVYAEKTGDAAVCRRIPAEDEEERSLRDACLSDVAEVTGRPALCEEITTPGLRDSCYLKLAASLDDASLCTRIRDEALRSGCTGEPVYVD